MTWPALITLAIRLWVTVELACVCWRVIQETRRNGPVLRALGAVFFLLVMAMVWYEMLQVAGWVGMPRTDVQALRDWSMPVWVLLLLAVWRLRRAITRRG